MLDPSVIEAGLRQLGPEQLRGAVADFLPKDASAAERVSAIEIGLRSHAGKSLREAMARWIVDAVVPVDALVPEAYVKWRPPVRDAMMFVIARLSPSRLAPKLLEQIELPRNTPPEIAKVPGLQMINLATLHRGQPGPKSLRNLAQPIALVATNLPIVTVAHNAQEMLVPGPHIALILPYRLSCTLPMATR